MTGDDDGRGLGRAAARALPRVGGAAAGAALLTSDGALAAAGVGVLVLSVWTDPVRWWQHVRTGRPAGTVPDAAFTVPGCWGVELEDAGARPIEVVKAVREVTSASYAEARTRVDHPPATLVEGLAEASAARVRDRVAASGATVRLVEERRD